MTAFSNSHTVSAYYMEKKSIVTVYFCVFLLRLVRKIYSERDDELKRNFSNFWNCFIVRIIVRSKSSAMNHGT